MTAPTADELVSALENVLAVNRVAVRLPTFCAADPEMWFSMVDSSFESAGVKSDKTKFGYVTAALDTRFALEVRDIIVNPPVTNAYETLKSELIKRLSSSQEQKTRQLLEHEEIGDRKPSQFLHHLRSLDGTAVPDSMLRTLWIGRLPTSMQAILATQIDVPLDRVAELADAIADSISPCPAVAETTAPQAQINCLISQVKQLTDSLKGEIASLRQEMSDLRVSDKKVQQSDKQRPRSRSRSRTIEHGKNGQCWYHWKYGTNARKCVQPCSFKSENAEGSR